ncbi:MAG TPA: hypothetical protein VFA33_06445 [Bryobacteraceae bacterium]|nr:hypothetical protein [Bryobacteraceae bacterium]
MKTAGLNRASFPAINPGTTQTLAIGSSSAATAAPIGADVVRLVATVDCYVAIGSSPTATASSMFLPAKMAEYFVLAQTDKIAVLQVSSGGTLYITPAA